MSSGQSMAAGTVMALMLGFGPAAFAQSGQGGYLGRDPAAGIAAAPPPSASVSADGRAEDEAAPAGSHGPIWGSRQHQPRAADVIARERAKGENAGESAETTKKSDRVYRRVLKQSKQATPRALQETE